MNNKSKNIVDIISQYSQKRKITEPISVSCFQIISNSNYISNEMFHFCNIDFFFYYGKFSFPLVTRSITNSSQFGFSSKIEITETPSSHWLFIIRNTQHNCDDPDDIKNLRGFLYILVGRNVAYEKFTEVKITPPDDISFSTNSFLNPSYFSMINIEMLEVSLKKLLINNKKNIDPKVKMALTWLTRSYESSGVDAFIYAWIAFEACAFISTNVVSSYHVLSEIYNVTKEEIKKQFYLGKIHGYRSDILHGKKNRDFVSSLLEYVTFIVSDVIMYQLFNIKLKKGYKYLLNNKEKISKSI